VLVTSRIFIAGTVPQEGTGRSPTGRTTQRIKNKVLQKKSS